MHNARDPMVGPLGHLNSARYRQSFRDYQAQTIDEFLGAYTQHSGRAKAEIAYHLIHCENSYSLMRQNNGDGWYRYLFKAVLGADPVLGSGKLSMSRRINVATSTRAWCASWRHADDQTQRG